MLKRILLSSTIVAISIASYGQATLSSANFNPVIGDAFSLKICDTTGVQPGSAGASITWNFSTGPTALNVTSLDTGYAVSCLSTPYFATFPSSTVAIKGPASTMASKSITYMIANTTTLAQNGTYYSSDTNLILTDPADQLRYPFTYMSNFSDTYSGILTMGTISAHHNGTINVVCDGYGTLSLPGRTDLNVLRVHTTQVFVDSTNVFGTPVFKTYNISSYDWYKPDYHTALLTIQTLTEVGAPYPTFKFVAFAAQQFTGVTDIKEGMTGVQVFPNPAIGAMNISYETAILQHVRVSINDIAGREIALISEKASKGKETVSFDASGIPKGLYLINIQSENGSVIRKVTLQ
jgi:hypothetical protein